MFSVMALELYLVAALLTVFFVDLFCKEKNSLLGWLTAGFLGLGIVLSFFPFSTTGEIFGGVYRKTEVSLIFERLFLLAGMFCALCSIDLLSNATLHKRPIFKGVGEYYLMLLFSIIGMCYLVSAEEMLYLYISLELATIPLFILACYLHSERSSAEAGIKFVIIGVLSSGLLLYGLSLLYGGLGGETLLLAELSKNFRWDGITVVGTVFVLAGLGFKVTAVPFHLWAPDVYQGAPTPITAFLSVGSKAAGLAVVFKLLHAFYVPQQEYFGLVMALLAAVTMTWGNLVAIKQRDIKRFLAYSSISQAGYALMAFLNTSALAVTSLVFYIFVYVVTNIAAFSVVIVYENQTGRVDIDGYRGFSRRNPLLALVMMLSLFSLAGIPPLAGFFGKFWLFAVAAQEGMYWLVLVAALNSTVSLYYYLQVVRRMYIMEPAAAGEAAETMASVETTPAMRLSLAGSTFGMLVIVVYPRLLEQIHAAATLMLVN